MSRSEYEKILETLRESPTLRVMQDRELLKKFRDAVESGGEITLDWYGLGFEATYEIRPLQNGSIILFDPLQAYENNKGVWNKIRSQLEELREVGIPIDDEEPISLYNYLGMSGIVQYVWSLPDPIMPVAIVRARKVLIDIGYHDKGAIILLNSPVLENKYLPPELRFLAASGYYRWLLDEIPFILIPSQDGKISMGVLLFYPHKQALTIVASRTVEEDYEKFLESIGAVYSKSYNESSENLVLFFVATSEEVLGAIQEHINEVWENIKAALASKIDGMGEIVG